MHCKPIANFNSPTTSTPSFTTFTYPFPSHSAAVSSSLDKLQVLVWLFFNLYFTSTSLSTSSSPDELQALIWTFFLTPMLCYLWFSLAIPLSPRLAAAIFYQIPFTCLTIPSSPDKLQVLIWLFFHLGLYLHPPFHVTQLRQVTSTRLDFFFSPQHFSLFYLHYHLNQLRWVLGISFHLIPPFHLLYNILWPWHVWWASRLS